MTLPTNPESHTAAQQFGRDFENYVASLYEGLGYDVITNASLSGQQIDVLAQKNVSGSGTIRIIIECKYRSHGKVSNQDVYDFTHMISAIKDSNKITKGIIVSNVDFSDAAYSAAQANGMIELLTTRMIENYLFEIQDAYREYVTHYEKTEIFSSYIPLHAVVRHFEPTGKAKSESKTNVQNIEAIMIEWIDSSELAFISILADYGSGKTTLLQKLKYHYAKSYIEGRSRLKPIFIPLKEFHKEKALDVLLQGCIRKEFNREIPSTLFWRAAEEGELLFLLDGFDEMALQVDKDRRRENFLILAPLLTLKSKAILTCRPSYFVTEKEYESAIETINAINNPLQGEFKPSDSKTFLSRKAYYDSLQARLYSRFIHHEPLKSLSHSHTRLIELQTLDEFQIDSFLKKFDELYKRVGGWDYKRVKKFLMNIYDLKDLMQRPILLAMINDTMLSGRIDIDATNVTLGPSSLYEIYTNMQLEIDWHKGEARQLLTKAQRREFAESIALAMFDGKKLEVSFEEIQEVARKNESILDNLRLKLDMVSVEQIAADIQICTFLSRHQDGFFRFSHKSFMEYFVACYLRKVLQANHSEDKFKEVLPKEVLYFLGGFAIIEPNVRQALMRWYNNKRVSRSIETFKRNIAAALMYSGPEYKNLKLENSAIFDIDIAKVNLPGAKFSNLTFRRVLWSNVTMESAKLLRIEFSDCGMNNSTMLNSTASGVQLTKCELNNLTVSESSFLVNVTGSSINRSVFTSSSLNISGRSAHIKNVVFEACDSQCVGELFLSDCQLLGGKLLVRYSVGGCLLKFNNCEFTNNTFIASPDYSRHPVELLKCKLIDCTVLGLQLSNIEYSQLELRGTKGMVFIDNPITDLEFPRDGILRSGHMLLLRKSIWLRPEAKDKLITLLEETIGQELSAELIANYQSAPY